MKLQKEGILYAPALIEEFRPWWRRWFTRLEGRWQPRVKWVTVAKGPLVAIQATKGGMTFTIDNEQ